MLSSLSQYVRMLDGRDRGQVIEVNREIALDLIERKQAIPIEDVTARDAFATWNDGQLSAFREQQSRLPIAEVTGVSVGTQSGEVPLPLASIETEVLTPRAKTKRR